MQRPRIDDLDWDTLNLEHIDKHGVTRDEVEEAVTSGAIFRSSYKNRLMATGPTLDGRMLTVIIGDRHIERTCIPSSALVPHHDRSGATI